MLLRVSICDHYQGACTCAIVKSSVKICRYKLYNGVAAYAASVGEHKHLYQDARCNYKEYVA
jgi:hypothetical protein